MTQRDFDIVVLGATGYSGQLVSEHLSKVAANGNVKWAVAGRDASKLHAVVDRVVGTHSAAAAVECVLVDLTKQDTVLAMCQRTRVVIACAGPFDTLGMKVVDACVQSRTHYVDITGEFQYVRKMIEAYDEKAKSANVMLVPCCGFDSVPSEMGNWYVHQVAKEMQGGPQPVMVEGFFSVAGGASGGTLASIANLFSTMERKDLSPVSLNAHTAIRPTSAPRVKGVSYNPFLARYVGPFLMASINERVVRRSNAISGRSTPYVEAAYGRWTQMVGAMVAMYAFGVIMSVPPLRGLLTKYVFPAQGTGPSDVSKQRSSYRALFVGTLPDQSKIEVHMKDARDAYTATGVFAASCGLVAAELASTGQIAQGGVLTASTAFGEGLYNKLRDAGISFTSRVVPASGVSQLAVGKSDASKKSE